MHKISPIVFVLLLLLPTLTGVGAQIRNGTIKATVLDQGKALLSGASITLTNVNTMAVHKCVSNEKGECRFEVPAGAYQVTTELSMFCPLEVAGIRLKENESVPVELKLTPVSWKDAGADYEKLLKTQRSF